MEHPRSGQASRPQIHAHALGVRHCGRPAGLCRHETGQYSPRLGRSPSGRTAGSALPANSRRHARSAARREDSCCLRHHESAMNKPRLFLGSSGEQAKLLVAITRGLEDVADVEPWTTTFNPGRSTLERLVELSQEVDFAAFVFAQDDWTTTDASESGQPRDNVVFEAGLFGGALGIRR